MTHLPNSHKGWEGKFIRLKSSSGFEVPLKWELVDGNQNRLSEATEDEHVLFTKVRAMSFSGKLVKDQVVVKKHWALPSIAV